MTLGAVLGLSLGVVLGLSLGALVGSLVGALVGSLVGSLVGALHVSSEGWNFVFRNQAHFSFVFECWNCVERTSGRGSNHRVS